MTFPQHSNLLRCTCIYLNFFRLCKEFEAIRDRALKVPETTEDMMEMITYIDQVKTKGIEELNNTIMVGTSELFIVKCSYCE